MRATLLLVALLLLMWQTTDSRALALSALPVVVHVVKFVVCCVSMRHRQQRESEKSNDAQSSSRLHPSEL